MNSAISISPSYHIARIFYGHKDKEVSVLRDREFKSRKTDTSLSYPQAKIPWIFVGSIFTKERMSGFARP
jgi:hypothetical protein